MLITLKRISNIEGYEMYIKQIKVNNLYKLAHFIGVDPIRLRCKLDDLLGFNIDGENNIYVPIMASVRVLSDMLNSLSYSYPQHNGPVFLGGTTCNTSWREEIIPRIRFATFNPVVEDWTIEHQENEKIMRYHAMYKLTVITPQMQSIYSIAEAVEDAILDKSRCIFCYLSEYGGALMNEGHLRSLRAVGNMIEKHGGVVLHSLNEVVAFLNQKNEVMLNNNLHISIEIESNFGYNNQIGTLI